MSQMMQHLPERWAEIAEWYCMIVTLYVWRNPFLRPGCTQHWMQWNLWGSQTPCLVELFLLAIYAIYVYSISMGSYSYMYLERQNLFDFAWLCMLQSTFQCLWYIVIRIVVSSSSPETRPATTLCIFGLEVSSVKPFALCQKRPQSSCRLNSCGQHHRMLLHQPCAQQWALPCLFKKGHRSTGGKIIH